MVDTGRYTWSCYRQWFRTVEVFAGCHGGENPTEQPTEKTTEPEITQPEKTDVKLEINGYQISTTKEGYRVIYSFEDSNSEVETVGLIYGLSVNDSDMVIGSSNSAVVNYQASDAGRMEKITAVIQRDKVMQ